ncbi:DUF418 domain-containing protein [Carboxylicivirga sp. M1479]|uniref:DUF418 domain-containing protein n=1 Tax=Carboxylicivirga sp. M1479 TaxID=2594476 RepID=UPI001177DB94|nr:DUF418 domain-containing protein [Carboxylicivirga sp. M1479]TRX61097.1 DUF418 domain-containing protein [Carboxylicivirga sp. M1479]
MEKKIRIEVVDALRGFAILGIMLLHSIEHFNFYVFPSADSQPAWLTAMDTVVWDSLFFVFGGKGYAIFSILFGFTFSLMMAKQAKQSYDFGYRFLWRLLLLVGFAIVNGFFFPGEVLMLYALVGVVLFLVRNLRNQLLLLVALVCLLQPIEWWHYIQYLTNADYVLPTRHGGQYWKLLKEAQMGDSFFNQVKANTLYGHKVSLIWAFEVGRLVQTAGLFIIGYWLGKNNKFDDNASNRRFWLRTLIISTVVFVPCYLFRLSIDALLEAKEQIRLVRPIVEMYRNVGFTLMMVASFILLFKTPFFNRLVSGLKYPGRMSLTAYVMQSVIGGFVFFGWGLGLGPEVRHTVSLGIGILLFAIQFYICKYWIIRYKQGPLEKLWHKLTWIRS